MALWCKVETGFDAEDETINFGPRQVAESRESVYETATLATIRPTEEIVENPKISATFQYSKLYIAIDKSITIFKDETCKEVALNINFDSMVVSYCSLKDELFLIVALESGILYCVYLPNNGEIIFTLDVNKNTNDSSGIMKVFVRDLNKVLFITRNGNVYSISNFSITSVYKAIIKNNKEKLKTSLKKIGCSLEFKKCIGSEEVVYATTSTYRETQTIAVLGKESIAVLADKRVNKSSVPCNFKKVQFLSNFGVMMCIRANDILAVACPLTFLGMNIYSKPIEDFVVLNNEAEDQCQLLILSTDKDSNTSSIRLASFPDYEEKFQINVSTLTYLVEDTHFSTDAMLFLESVVNDNGIVTSIRIKNIMEKSPELYLERLLRRRQFSKAHIIADKFHLPKEVIYYETAKVMVEELNSFGERNVDPLKIDEFIGTLDHLQNVEHIIDCCDNVVLFNYHKMRKLFLYARERITKDIESNESKEKSDALRQHLFMINNLLHKLRTFEIINGNVIYNKKCRDTLYNWKKFSEINLLEKCKMYLNMGELETAALIWSRHLPDICKEISITTVKDIFAVIPEKPLPVCLWLWLFHFIPSLLSLLPNALDEVVSWIYQKLKSLEHFSSKSWPKCGIDFVTKIVNLLKFDTPSLNFEKECMNKNSSLGQLNIFIQGLSDLQLLKTKYSIKIPFNYYIGEPNKVVYLLLYYVRNKDIDEFIEKFLKKYMLNHSLNNDTVLSSFIQKIIKDSMTYWKESRWEKKVAIIISFIHDLQPRLQQILNVLKEATVPWSVVMLKLAEDGSSYDDALSSKIRSESEYVLIKMILKKYNFQHIGTNDRLISCIIRENREEMISDINKLTKFDQDLRQKGFSRCIIHNLNLGNIDIALKVMENLEDDVAIYCYEYIIYCIISRMRLKNFPDSLKHYIEILPWIKIKLRKILKLKSKLNRINDALYNISVVRPIYNLRKEFNINVTFTDYHIKKICILKDFISKLCKEITSKDVAATVAYKKIVRVADLIKLERMYAVLLLFENSEEIDLMNCVIGYNLNFDVVMEECKYMKKMCLLAILNDKITVEMLNIVQNLCSSMLSTCHDTELDSILFIKTWANLYLQCCGFKNDTSNTNFRLYTKYKDLIAFQNVSLLPRLQEMLIANILYAGFDYLLPEDDNPFVDFKSTEELQEALDQFFEELIKNLRSTQMEHNEYILVKTIKTVHISYCFSSFLNTSKLIKLEPLLTKIILSLLKKLVSFKKFDLHLSMCCLLMLPEQSAVKWLLSAFKLFQGDYNRHSIISTLGYEYFSITSTQPYLQTFESKKLLHYWAKKLSAYSIVYKEVLVSDNEEKRQFLSHIMTFKDEKTISILQQFCISFGFDVDDCLMLYLQTIIKTWNPTLTVSNLSNKKELKINPEEVNELKANCNAVIAKISNKPALLVCLRNMWTEINFYHYEAFLIILNITEDDENMEKRNYLHLLQSYTRSGESSSIEKEEWARLNLGSRLLPAIAEYRLPYLPKIDIWKLITPELNLKTYETWLKVAPVLKLDPCNICTLAVKGEVTRVWGSQVTKEWLLLSKNSTFLKNVRRCIQQMTGPKTVYYGMVALYHVVNYIPPGADQVAAVKECLSYAKKYKECDPNMLEKIKSKYYRFTSEHILRTHGLEQDTYLALTSSPSKLVHALYMDKSILIRCRDITNYRPDINSAFNELCKLYSFNLTKLRFTLVENWLKSNYKPLSSDYSLTESFLYSPVSTKSNDDDDNDVVDNLSRACYLLQQENVEYYIRFLVNVSFDYNYEESYSFEVQYRALYILQCVMDPITLQKFTKRDLDTIRQYTQSLYYLSKLEASGLNYDVNTFEECSKYEVVNSLWQMEYNSPRSLILMADICIDYKVYDYEFWDRLLTQMAKLNMVQELRKILLQIYNLSDIIHCKGYVKSWQVVTTEPFKKMDNMPTSAQVHDCVTAIHSLQSCPVACDLDFDNILEYCLLNNQPHLAGAFFFYLREDQKKYVVKMYKEKFVIEKVINDLLGLSSKGILFVSDCVAELDKAIKRTLHVYLTELPNNSIL